MSGTDGNFLFFVRGENGDLKTLRHVEAMKEEMADMQVKVTPAGNEQYGAWREGGHDDLVFAVALACWGAKKRYPVKPTGAAAYWIGRGPWGRR